MLANLDLLTLPTAFVLDLLIGDPLWMPHPVRWMGKAIERCEPLFRSRFGPPEKAGLRFAVYLISTTSRIQAATGCHIRANQTAPAAISRVALIR